MSFASKYEPAWTLECSRSWLINPGDETLRALRQRWQGGKSPTRIDRPGKIGWGNPPELPNVWSNCVSVPSKYPNIAFPMTRLIGLFPCRFALSGRDMLAPVGGARTTAPAAAPGRIEVVMNRVALALVSVLGAAGAVTPALAQQQTQTSASHQYVVFFRDGQAALTPDGDQIVQRIAAAAKQLHPGRIEVIGSNDGMSRGRENVADQRAATVAQSLAKAGINPTVIARAGNAEPSGTGSAAHRVVVRFEQPEARGEVAEGE
jgi:flagellar motor protein MotB